VHRQKQLTFERYMRADMATVCRLLLALAANYENSAAGGLGAFNVLKTQPLYQVMEAEGTLQVLKNALIGDARKLAEEEGFPLPDASRNFRWDSKPEVEKKQRERVFQACADVGVKRLQAVMKEAHITTLKRKQPGQSVTYVNVFDKMVQNARDLKGKDEQPDEAGPKFAVMLREVREVLERDLAEIEADKNELPNGWVGRVCKWVDTAKTKCAKSERGK